MGRPACERPHLWKGLAAEAILGLGVAPGAGAGLIFLENALPIGPDIERRDDPCAARLRVREGNSAPVKST